MDNSFEKNTDDDIVQRASPGTYSEGITGMNALAEMTRRLKDSILEQQNATNRLTSWLIVLTAVILLLTAVMAAPLVRLIFNFYFSTQP